MAHNTPCFPQSFADLLFPVSPGYWKLMQFLLGRGGGETRKFKGNVEVDKRFVLSLFRRDLLLLLLLSLLLLK